MKTDIIIMDDADSADKIIDALEKCSATTNNGNCANCSYKRLMQDTKIDTCFGRLMSDAATIIRRLKAKSLTAQLKLRVFVDDFCDYLLGSKNNCNQFDDERSDIEACVYEEVFQMFGRMIESKFEIDVFDKEVEE